MYIGTFYDQILKELRDQDLNGRVYGFTPFCNTDENKNEATAGFRFWEQGFWSQHLRGTPYHISALFVVDLNMFREKRAGDILRSTYQQLTADPHSLSNLDQDLPNYVQRALPIYSLPQDWLWCESWCSLESKPSAKTIDMCNNPLTKEPKLLQAARIAPEWTEYDERAMEILKGAQSGTRDAGEKTEL